MAALRAPTLMRRLVKCLEKHFENSTYLLFSVEAFEARKIRSSRSKWMNLFGRLGESRIVRHSKALKNRQFLHGRGFE